VILRRFRSRACETAPLPRWWSVRSGAPLHEVPVGYAAADGRILPVIRILVVFAAKPCAVDCILNFIKRISSDPGAMTKRLYRVSVLDRAIGILLLIIVSPLFGSIALLLKLESGEPIFRRHRRIDALGRPFETLSFRVYAEGLITTTGRFLVYARLEELPVLISIATGRARFALAMGPDQEIRFAIESTAQINTVQDARTKAIQRRRRPPHESDRWSSVRPRFGIHDPVLQHIREANNSMYRRSRRRSVDYPNQHCGDGREP
jgi:hypothetical protein